MSALCPNCKAQITCSCQNRQASDGRKVCKACLPAYEALLIKNKKAGVVTAPSNVTVLYDKKPPNLGQL